MKKVFIIFLCFFLLLSLKLSAQYWVSGNNLYSSAKFITPGGDSSLYVVGEFLTYEIVNEFGPNITSYTCEIGDSTIYADSCGYDHFTYKTFVSKISHEGILEWIQISESCDTLSSVQVREIASDADKNLLITGTYNNKVEIADSALSSDAKWDMFIYKISPDGEIIWQKNDFARGDSSTVFPNDITCIANDIYISGSYSGEANFAGESFLSTNEQFFLLKVNESGEDYEITAGIPLHSQSSSELNDIDYDQNNDIAGIISLKDSVLVAKLHSGFTRDTIYRTGGFAKKVMYVVDSIDINDVSTVVDSFYTYDPPNPDHLFYIVDSADVLKRSIIRDSIYWTNTDSPLKQNFISFFRGDSLALSQEIPDIPIEFQIDKNDNNLYGLHNYSKDLKFGTDLIPEQTYNATAIVKYNFSGGTDWFKLGYSPTDTVQGNSFYIDKDSDIFIAGSVGKQNGNHVLNFDGQNYEASTDEDCFVVKLEGGNLSWGQILGDSATDKINDIYAPDKFNILVAGEYSKQISHDKFSITTSGVRDMFAGSIDPFPAFDLEVISFRDENLPLCEGDSVKLTANSSHNCSMQWLKDSIAISGATNDSLWVKESGIYHLEASSNEITHDDMTPYIKSSKSFLFEYSAYPNDLIIVNDSILFCSGDQATLVIELNADDSCSWYSISNGFIDSTNQHTVSQTGKYFARIEGKSGCISWSDTLSITAVELPNDSISIIGENHLFCEGDSLEIKNYDPGPNTYVWHHDGDSLTSVTNSVIAFDEEGTYSAEIINEHNCSVHTDTLVLVEITPPVLQQWFEDEVSGICEGESAEIRLSNHGETEYFWFHDNVSIPDNNFPVFYAEEAGFYHATLIKEGVCFTQSDTFKLKVHPLPVAQIKADGDTVICDNESTHLSIETSDDVTYNWFHNGELLEGINNPSVEITESGMYSSEVSNEYNCSLKTRTIPIIVKRSPNLKLISENNKTAFCQKDSIRLYVENSSTVTYQWQKDGIPLSPDSREYYATNGGEYIVLLKDTVSDCSAQTNTLEVIELLPPDNSINFVNRSPLCDRDTLVLSSSAPSAIFEWYKDGELLILQTQPSIKVFKDGNYSLKVKDENNCSAQSENITLNFLNNPIPPIQQDVNYLSTLLYDNLQWYKYNIAINQAQGQVYMVNESGFYHVEVMYANGCSAASQEKQVCVPFPEISLNQNVLRASPGKSYQWFFGSDTIYGANDQVYEAQLSGYYSVDITLSDACISRSEEIEVCYPIPEIEIEVNNVLKASLGLRYQWYLNNEPIPNAEARLYVVYLEGEYKVELQDLNNCISFSDPVYMQGTDIEDLNYKSVEVFPNPFDTEVNITMPEDFGPKTILKISNALGMVIFEKTIHTNPERINLSMLKAGFYIATLEDTNHKVEFLLIKNF